MPTEPKAGTTRFNPWLITIGLAIAILLIVWFVETRPAVVNSDNQAALVMQEAKRLSLTHLEDFDKGIPPTESDKEDLRKAAVDFDSLSDYKPGDIRPWFGAGKCYQALGNDDAAIKRFEDGLNDMAPDQAPVLVDTATEAHYLLSVSLFNKRDYQDALKEVNIAISRLPMVSPIYLSQRASIYVQMSPPRYADALADLVRALKADPHHEKSLRLLKLITMSAQEALDEGLTDFGQKKYKPAIDACNKALAILPENVKLLLLRAACYSEIGQKTLADADKQKLMSRVESELRAGNNEVVVADCTDALSLPVRYPPLLDLRARAYLASGNADQAGKDLAQIRKFAPGYPGLADLEKQLK